MIHQVYLRLTVFAQATGIVSQSGRECLPELAGIAIGTMPPLCRMLEAPKSKSKTEEKVKAESDVPITPSPSKKLATELEKKVKNMPGDVSVVKVPHGKPT